MPLLTRTPNLCVVGERAVDLEQVALGVRELPERAPGAAGRGAGAPDNRHLQQAPRSLRRDRARDGRRDGRGPRGAVGVHRRFEERERGRPDADAHRGEGEQARAGRAGRG
eukprot:869729-Rhodomonas_salina.2